MSLLDWMKRNPHLSEWDFMLALAPAEVDTLVQQHHRLQMSKGRDVAWERVEIRLAASRQTHILSHYRLGAPNLDWSQSSYDNPRVGFSLQADGGMHVLKDDDFDVLAISAHDALDGLQLRGLTRFTHEDLRLGLDLKQPEAESLEFDLGDSLQEKWAGGAFMADYLQHQLEDDQGVYTLADVSTEAENPFLRSRTIGARVMVRASDKRASLVLFGSLERGPAGVYPPAGSDFPFLLPDEMAERAPTTLLLSRRVLHRAAYAYAMDAMLGNGAFNYGSTPEGALQWMQAKAGTLQAFELEHMASHYQFKSARFSLEAGAGAIPLKAEFDEDEVKLQWQSKCTFAFMYKLRDGEGWLPLSGTFEFRLHHRFYLFRPSTEETDGGLIMGEVAWPWATQAEVKVLEGLPANLPEALYDEIDQFVGLVLKQALLEGLAGKLTARVPETLLQGLILAQDGTFAAQEVEFPHGLALFGTIAGNAAGIQIRDQGVQLAPLQEHTFQVVSPFAAVTWGLESLPGNAGDIGQIDPDTGHYRAPPAHALGYRQARILVVATDKLTRARSTTLLTVLAQSINANPRVRVCSYGDRLTFTAGALDGRAQWQVVEQDGSGRVLPSDDGSRCTYIAGEQLEEGGYLLDKIEVTNSATGEVIPLHVLVMQEAPGLYLEAQAPDRDGSVQLKAYFNGMDKTAQVQWRQQVGDGYLEDHGLYWPADAGLAPYALFTALLADTPFGDLHGHLLLPLDPRRPSRLRLAPQSPANPSTHSI
ncbi:hypothetical protein [Pseudomonas sp.]|uniref:hypothetical protein n=1 Tax=Pseudomonas sp. TaxID=306 RepID=UPI001B064D0E|nr:hypothetical protein [Pseudomonas sp.]MBO9549828.1 hypothetical protein [Pseudomonas sp.]